MKKRNFIKCCSIFLLVVVCAQNTTFSQDTANKVWTLEECINHAVANNFEMQQFVFQREQANVNTNTAKNAFLPVVQGRVRNVHNWGLFIDPSTNLLTTQNNEIYAGSVETEWMLFNGGYNYYMIKQNQELYNASTANQQLKSNQISLMVIGAYYQMLYATEQLAIARQQKGQTMKQYNLVSAMVETGILHKRELLLMDSELSLREVEITDAQNIFLKSNLLLRQTMGITDRIQVVIDTTTRFAIPDSAVVSNLDSICNKAGYFLPELDIAKSNLKAAKYKLKVAQTYLYPSLSLSAGILTKSSSLIQMEQGSQFKQNLSQYVAFNLGFPIFNRFQTRNSIALSKMDIIIQENEVKKKNLEVEQLVQVAYLDLVAANKKYWSVSKQVNAFQSQYTLAEKSYSAGIINHTEFSYSSNLFNNALNQFLQTKYDYFYKKEVLDFYAGKGFCRR